MERELSDYSTEDLLRMIDDGKDREGAFSYNATQCLFKRWRNGRDLPALVELLESEVTRERTRGAYYMQESVPRGEGFTDAAIKLAQDSHSYCRRAFVHYMINTGLYGEKISVGLAHGLFDYDLGVRLETINWSVYTTDARFDDFCRLVEAGTGAASSAPWRGFQLERGARGLAIAERLRKGEPICEIRRSTPGEDSYIFDYFQRFERRLQGYAKRREINMSKPVATEWPGYDDFAIGVLGERYDNLGRLQGDLPKFG